MLSSKLKCPSLVKLKFGLLIEIKLPAPDAKSGAYENNSIYDGILF
jgi:hypothetical protein